MNENFKNKIKSYLDESLNDISDETLNKLSIIRMKALKNKKRENSLFIFISELKEKNYFNFNIRKTILATATFSTILLSSTVFFNNENWSNEELNMIDVQIENINLNDITDDESEI